MKILSFMGYVVIGIVIAVAAFVALIIYKIIDAQHLPPGERWSPDFAVIGITFTLALIFGVWELLDEWRKGRSE